MSSTAAFVSPSGCLKEKNRHQYLKSPKTKIASLNIAVCENTGLNVPSSWRHRWHVCFSGETYLDSLSLSLSWQLCHSHKDSSITGVKGHTPTLSLHLPKITCGLNHSVPLSRAPRDWRKHRVSLFDISLKENYTYVMWCVCSARVTQVDSNPTAGFKGEDVLFVTVRDGLCCSDGFTTRGICPMWWNHTLLSVR